MAEDWRVKVEFPHEEHGHRLSGFLRDQYEVEEDLAERLRGRVVVSQDGPVLFLYAETRDQAEAATQVVHSFLKDYEQQATIELKRWHEAEERWEDPSVPLPDTPEELHEEQEKLADSERAESKEEGVDEWEVQIVLPDHRSTKELAEKLEAEGMEPLRRWRFLVIPVPSEEDGNALADRLRQEAPPDAKIAVEASYAQMVAENPQLSAFSIFGGLGA